MDGLNEFRYALQHIDFFHVSMWSVDICDTYAFVGANDLKKNGDGVFCGNKGGKIILRDFPHCHDSPS